jgi:hypothetical protein
VTLRASSACVASLRKPHTSAGAFEAGRFSARARGKLVTRVVREADCCINVFRY